MLDHVCITYYIAKLKSFCIQCKGLIMSDLAVIPFRDSNIITVKMIELMVGGQVPLQAIILHCGLLKIT